MARVIGIDFGNWMAYVCTIEGMDPETRMGGKVMDLIPSRYLDRGSSGIPNEFFWNSASPNGRGESNEQYGFLAAREMNRPAENHLRLLKRHLGESVTLYGDAAKTHAQTFQYDDIITKMFAYHIQLANEALRTNYGESETTNLVSITYPAKLRDPGMLRYFIDLAEKADSGATDNAGKPLKIKVVGAVCEPAAAGLDRLNEVRDTITSDVVHYGTFDLGGGTFDLSIVSLFPNGRKYPSGNVYYYDQICEGKGLNIAGSNFSDRLRTLVIEKATAALNAPPNQRILRLIDRNIERCKLELSDDTTTEIILESDDDVAVIQITRKEFENAIKPDMDKIMEFTRSFFDEHRNHLPDEIIMTGGSCWIPYVKTRLEETLPEYRGKIHLHRPSKAAAYGAARFYALNIESGDSHNPPPVRKHVERDLGTLVRIPGTDTTIMNTLISKNTELPCDSGVRTFQTAFQSSLTDYDIYVAKTDTPDPHRPLEDYTLLQHAILTYRGLVPAGTRTSCRLTIDELGAARLEAWMDSNTDIEIHLDFSINNATDDSSQ